MKIFILSFLMLQFVHAFEVNVKHESFDNAGSGAGTGSVVFESESTKLGIITTSFEGRALEFTVSGRMTKDKVDNVEVIVPVRKMSTDIDGRDEKMWDEVLEEKKYPLIKVMIASVVHGFDGVVESIIEVKGRRYSLPLKLTTTMKNSILRVVGSGSFSLKAYQLPDPSIAIASVRDSFDLKFEMEIK